MKGIMFHLSGQTEEVLFQNPKDLFGGKEITFVGAFYERNLIFMGLPGATTPNPTIPQDLIDGGVWEDKVPKGPILLVETDDNGNPL